MNTPLIPATTESTTEQDSIVAVDYSLSISLTFTNLTTHQYHIIKHDLTKLIARLLDLDINPFLELSTNERSFHEVQVYFALRHNPDKSTLLSYVEVLVSTNDSQWIELSQNYVSNNCYNCESNCIFT